MKIPEIRGELHDLADKIGGAVGDRVHFLAEETKRRTPVRRAPARRKRKTLDHAAVRVYAGAHPDADYMTIARVFNTNTGGVSEALAGYRQ